MKYKVIVSDFDGTIYSQKRKEIPQCVKDSIKRYESSGGKFVLCTGRMYNAIKRYTNELGLNGELLCLQGSVCMDLSSEKELFVFDIPYDTTYRIAKFAEEQGWIFHFYHDLRVFTKDINPYTELYEDLAGISATYTKDNVSATIRENGYTAHKFIVMTKPEDAKTKIDLLKKEFPEIDVSQSSPIFIELVDRASGKGNAVLRLAQALDIKIEEVAVMGDEGNDLPMLKVAGLPLAPENAVDEVKNIAKYIYPSVHEGGASEVIEKIINGEL